MQQGSHQRPQDNRNILHWAVDKHNQPKPHTNILPHLYINRKIYFRSFYYELQIIWQYLDIHEYGLISIHK